MTHPTSDSDGGDEATAELAENTRVMAVLRRQRDTAESTLRALADHILSSHNRVIGPDGTTGVPLEGLLSILRSHGHEV